MKLKVNFGNVCALFGARLIEEVPTVDFRDKTIVIQLALDAGKREPVCRLSDMIIGALSETRIDEIENVVLQQVIREITEFSVNFGNPVYDMD